MMCLGWYNRPTCETRPQVQVAGTQESGGLTGAAPCPDITWFWLAAAGIVGFGMMKAKG